MSGEQTKSRILFFSPVDHFRGSPKVLHFANWLSDQGHDVGILTPRKPSWVQNEAIRFWTLNSKDLPKIRRYVTFIRQALRCIRSHRADLVVAVNDPGAIVGAWSSSFSGVPFVVLAQERAQLGERPVKTRLLARHFRRARAVFDTSPQAADMRKSAMGLTGFSGTFLNVPPLQPTASPAIEDENGRSPTRMIYVGFIGPKVCLTELLEAVHESQANLCLDIYGSGDPDYEQKVSDRIKKLELSERACFHGEVIREDLRKVLAKADVGVVLYATAGSADAELRLCSPNKLFEYASAGMAILASDQVTNRSWVNSNDIGVCVNPHDPASLVDGIRRLCDHSIREQMRRNALRTYRDKWNMEVEAPRVWKLIQQAVADRNAWANSTGSSTAAETVSGERSEVTESAPPSISVLIPTFRRWPYLQATVEHLNQQTSLPDEIVIVDQTPRDELPEGQPERMIASSSVPIVYERQEEPLVYRARNRCAHLSSSEVLLYLDDDVIPDRGMVKEHRRILSDRDVDALCGYATIPGREGDHVPAPPDDVMLEDFVFAWRFTLMDRRLERIPGIAAGHFSIRKNVLAEIGGWDEHIITYGDKDIGLRLFKAGKNIVYDPSPKLIHLSASVGGSRLPDVNSPWRSWQRTTSCFYLAFRHLRGKYFWKYGVVRAARASFLLKRNAKNPLSWPREVWGFIRGYWIARRWARQGVHSSFPNHCPVIEGCFSWDNGKQKQRRPGL